MNTLKNIAVGIGIAALFGAMIVGSAMDIGRLDPFAGSPEESREFCGNTPPNMMNEEELQQCAWLREEDERPYVPEESYSTDIGAESPSTGSSYDGP